MTATADPRHEIADAIRHALERAQHDDALPRIPAPEIRIERPQKREHGDYACNVALRLASAVRMPPMEVAERIAAEINLSSLSASVEVVRPGFLNFRIELSRKRERLLDVIEAGAAWGRVNVGDGKRVQVEFVSANPTGPLQLGNGRGAVLGDVLANVLTAAGFDVDREYYINDVGNQVRIFGGTLLAQYRLQLKKDANIPKEGYHGDYMADLAQRIVSLDGEFWLKDGHDPSSSFIRRALGLMVEQIRDDLDALKVQFDIWFPESRLHETVERGSGQGVSTFDTVKRLLEDKGLLYQKDGAIWLRHDLDGEDEDENQDNVLIRANKEPSYFGSDIAYHYNKLIERRYDTVIDVWGADHHGHIARTKSAIAGVDGDPDALKVLLYQLVHLRKGGERVRMSKRKGEFVALKELIDDIGPDAVRFFMLQRSAEAQMDFDLEAARSEDPATNPAMYVKYQHVRCCSIIRDAKHLGVTSDEIELSLLIHDRENMLIDVILRLPELVFDMALDHAPHQLTTYAVELAQAFSRFYDHPECRVLDTSNGALSGARLLLVDAARVSLAATLVLLGIDAPRSMHFLSKQQPDLFRSYQSGIRDLQLESDDDNRSTRRTGSSEGGERGGA